MGPQDTDKTVFRQDFGAGDGDRTVIRPSPGRRGMQPAAGSLSPGARDAAHSPNPPPAAAHDAPAAYVPRGDAPGRHELGSGLNALVDVAATVLAALYRTRVAPSHPNVGALHAQLGRSIREFDANAKERNIRPEVVLAARYVLCAALDEAVLNTPWGAESAWTQRTLLSLFHNETNGGEKFFLILDRMREHPAQNLDMLELMYVLLSLGFEGKYRVVHRGRDQLEQIRDELFRVIRVHRGEYERTLSPHWQGLGRRRSALTHYVPVWVAASVLAAIMALSYGGFRYALHASTLEPTQQLLELAAPTARTATLERAP